MPWNPSYDIKKSIISYTPAISKCNKCNCLVFTAIFIFYNLCHKYCGITLKRMIWIEKIDEFCNMWKGNTDFRFFMRDGIIFYFKCQSFKVGSFNAVY